MKQPNSYNYEPLNLGSNISWTVNQDVIKVNDTLLAYRAGIQQVDRRWKPKGEVWWVGPGLDPTTHGHVTDVILTSDENIDAVALMAKIRAKFFNLDNTD